MYWNWISSHPPVSGIWASSKCLPLIMWLFFLVTSYQGGLPIMTSWRTFNIYQTLANIYLYSFLLPSHYFEANPRHHHTLFIKCLKGFSVLIWLYSYKEYIHIYSLKNTKQILRLKQNYIIGNKIIINSICENLS